LVDKFHLAKQKNLPQLNSKKDSKEKKHNYQPLDEKTVKKLSKKHRAWQRHMETREGKNIKNMLN
jgi:hypothetical protein